MLRLEMGPFSWTSMKERSSWEEAVNIPYMTSQAKSDRYTRHTRMMTTFQAITSAPFTEEGPALP